MPLVLALDQGTTSSRAILFDDGGDIIAVAQKELPQIYPRAGWVEHDPEAVWSTQIGVAAEAMARAGVRFGDLAALGITNQRETAIVWERKTGRPIANAIVWQDRRTAGVCDRLRADGHEPTIRQKTGLVVDAYFSGPKVAWLLDSVSGARKRAEAGELAFGTVDSWLIWKLTGGRLHVTDATNASRTMLYNIHTGRWDDELLALIRVPREMLPEVRGCSEIYAEAIEMAGVTIAGVAGDQQAALIGQTCFMPGAAKNTYGTGCFLLINTGDEASVSPNRLITTIGRRIGERVEYALEGSVFIAGAVVQWLRDGLGIIRSADEIEMLAQTVPDNHGVYFVPAFAGLGAPHWDGYARGAIVGLTRGVTAAHLARAALEGIAHQVADVIDAARAGDHLCITDLRVDGGAAVNDLLMQTQADLLQLPVVRPAVTETTALGAAYLAGLATGVWKSDDDVASHWRVERTFDPGMSADEAAQRRGQWNAAVKRATQWASPDDG